MATSQRYANGSGSQRVTEVAREEIYFRVYQSFGHRRDCGTVLREQRPDLPLALALVSWLSIARNTCITMKKPLLVLLIPGLILVVLLQVGFWLTRPALHEIGAPPTDLPIRPVALPSQSGSTLRGWFVPGRRGKGAILLMHGIHANRLAMLARARFLHCAGYSVFLFDFQAHGESPGHCVTFGAVESLDAYAAAKYLRRQVQGEKVGAIGTSLGGAAALLGREPLPVDALVLESVYPTIEEATANRLRLHFGRFGPLLTPWLMLQMWLQFGISASELQPIERVQTMAIPVFVIAGTEDQHTTVAESLRIFGAANVAKEWWGIEGAAHVDLYQFAPPAYEERILSFFARTLH